MSKVTSPAVTFRTGSFKQLKLGIYSVLQSFPKFFSKDYCPVLSVYPATENTVMSFKLKWIGWPHEVAPLPVLSSMVREVLRENQLVCAEDRPLVFTPKRPNHLTALKAQRYVCSRLLNVKTADPDLFAKVPVMSRREYEHAVAEEEVASEMLFRGELTLADYLAVLLPQIQGQKTVMLAASSSNASYICDYFNAHGLSAGAVVATTSLNDRKRLVEDLRAGQLGVLVFDRPTPDGEEREDLPLELGFTPRTPHDEVIDIADKVYAEPRLNWRWFKNEDMVVKYFPKQPTADDLLDLLTVSRKLKSNVLDCLVRKRSSL
jgi:hypothetical protein